MSEIRPRFYVHKQKASWIIVRMGSDHVVFGSATPSVPVWQKWDEWHDKNVEDGAWIEITYANMRPPTRELDDLKTELKEKVRLIEDLRAEMDSESLNVQTLEQKLAIATAQINDLNQTIGSQGFTCRSLRAEMEKRDQAIHTMKANMGLSTDQCNSIEALQSEVTRLTSDRRHQCDLIVGMRKEVERLTKSNENLSQEMDRVKCDRTYGRGRIKTLREELALRDETIQLLTSKLGEKGDEIKALREEVGQADDLRANIACRDETITLLNKKIVEQADQIRTMQALAGKPWQYTPTRTFAEMPPSDIAGNPVDLTEIQEQLDQHSKDIHSLGLVTKKENVDTNRRIDELQSELRDSIGNLARNIGHQITNMDDWVRVRTAGLQHDLDRRYVCEDGKIVEAPQNTADGRTPPGEPFVFSDKDPGKQYEIEGLQGQIDELTKRFHEFRNYAIARDTQKDGLIATLAKRVQTLEEKP